MKSRRRISTSDYRRIKEDSHKNFLKDPSTKLLSNLFSELGIVGYVVNGVFIEPRSSLKDLKFLQT